ncbi:MAG: hypothetical protein ABSB31_10290 [Dehalococcoidia bacterium]
MYNRRALDFIFLLLGIGTTCFFTFLERGGLLRRRWVLALIGIAGIVLFAVAAELWKPDWLWLIVSLGLIATLAVIYVAFRVYKISPKVMTATQLYDLEMGKHRSTIERVLATWKKQLHALSKKDRLKYDDFALEIERDGYFRFALTHCPSLNNEYATFLIGIGLYQQKFKQLEELKKKQQSTQKIETEIKNDRSPFERRIKSQIELIDKSLRSLEYEKNRCPGCPTNMAKDKGVEAEPTTGIEAENSFINAPRLKTFGLDKSIVSKGSVVNIPDAEIRDERKKDHR